MPALIMDSEKPKAKASSSASPSFVLSKRFGIYVMDAQETGGNLTVVSSAV